LLTNVSPAVDYFFISNDYTPVPNVSVALEFQDRLVAFVNGKLRGWPSYGPYGNHERMFNITEVGFEMDDFSGRFKERCDIINGVLLDPANGV